MKKTYWNTLRYNRFGGTITEHFTLSADGRRVPAVLDDAILAEKIGQFDPFVVNLEQGVMKQAGEMRAVRAQMIRLSQLKTG